MNAEREERRDRLRFYLFLGALLCVSLILHTLIRTDYGDDEYFRELWDGTSLGSFLRGRYEGWSSRLVIETVLMLLAAAPEWVWKLLNSLVILLLVWNTADLFGMRRKRLQAAVFFSVTVWMVPPLAIAGAGWISTTTNYLWPLSFGLVAIRPLKHILCGEGIPAWEYAAVPVCILYAANMEQMAAILLGAYLAAGVYQLIIKKRRPPVFYFVCTALIAAMLFFILSCPGNMGRFDQEVESFFPEFRQYGIWEKLVLGFIENGHYFASAGYFKTNYLFALLAGVLAARVVQRKVRGEEARPPRRFWLELAVSAVPLAFFWGVAMLANKWLEKNGFSRGGHIVGLLCQNRYLPGTHEFSWGTFTYSWGMLALQIGVYAGLAACVALTVYFLHGKSGETLLELVVLGAGMASHMILGFSPTVYISSERTALFCDMAILIVVMRNLQVFWGNSGKLYGRLLVGAYIAVGIWGNPSLRLLVNVLRFRFL